MQRPQPTPKPEIASAVVSTPDGQPVDVETLWRDRPAVLVFLRHFG